MNYLKLARPKQIIKNLLCFLPIFFAKSFAEEFLPVGLIFVLFALVSSLVYVINDITDIESDKNHPTKKNRPLASGVISKHNGIIFAVIIEIFAVILGVFITIFVSLSAVLVVLLYFVINVLYSVFKLKNIPIIDVFIVMIGFILRVYAGAFAGNINLSKYFVLCLVGACLFMAFGKRRNEFAKQIDGKNTRKVLGEYTYNFLNSSLILSEIVIILAYMWWLNDLSANFGFVQLASFVMLLVIILQYNFLLEKDDISGDPTDLLLQSKQLWFTGAVFAAILFVQVYL